MAAQGAAAHGAPVLLSTVAACALAGVGLNYAMFLCTTSNSALTTTIVGVLKVGASQSYNCCCTHTHWLLLLASM